MTLSDSILVPLDIIRQGTGQMSKQIGYRRVSSVDQNMDRQLVDIELDKVFEDKVSGGTTKRPGLTDCLEYLRDGDTLHVHSIDRLARNMPDLLDIVKGLTDKGIAVHFHKENMVFGGKDAGPMQTLMFQMLGSFAEFERSIIRERQAEGIKAAQAKGTQFGAPAKLTPADKAEIRSQAADGMSVTVLARDYGVSRQTIYTAIKATG